MFPSSNISLEKWKKKKKGTYQETTKFFETLRETRTKIIMKL